MAYNPFDFFRRNQKILFAVLTVFIMFMFVLSFGRGDFFDWLPRWLGSKQSYGDVMAVVDGDKIRESDLSKIRDQRQKANEYMLIAQARTTQILSKQLLDLTAKVSTENKQLFQQFGQLRQFQYLDIMTRFQLMQGQVPPQQAQQVQNQNIFQMKASLQQILQESKNNDDLDAARVADALLTADIRQMNPRDPKLYFGNQPSFQVKDEMDFYLWLKKAEDMGIRYTTEDVDTMIEQEFLMFNSEERATLMNQLTEASRGVTKPYLYECLTKEFQVRTVQSALLGVAEARGQGGVYGNPYDFYEYFKDQASPARFGMITVPVENYVSQVTGEPTESELRDIFSRYKNTEPNPASSKPGLKKPRELKLKWAEVTGKEPFYVAAGQDAVKKVEPAAKLSGFLNVPFGLGGWSLVASVAPLTEQDLALQAEYAAYKNNFKFDVLSWFQKPFPGETFQVRDTSVAQPENLAILAGLSLNPLSTPASLTSAFLPMLARTSRIEDKLRLQAGLPMLLMPTLPGLAGISEFAGAAIAQQESLPKPLPASAVRESLAKDAANQLQFSLAQKDVAKMVEEINKFFTDAGKDVAKAEEQAKPVIDKFIQERGLRTGASTEFHDQYSIRKDDGLAELRRSFEGSHSGGSAAALGFARSFFFDVETLQDGRNQREVDTKGLYKPQSYPEPELSGPQMTKSQYLAWRSEEIPAESAKSLTAAKDKCIAVWRHLKAREIAKEAAEALAKEARALNADSVKLALDLPDLQKKYMNQFEDLNAKDRVRYFEMNDVANFQINSLFRGDQYTINRFQMMPNENTILYPTQELVTKLADARNEPVGTTLVLKDNPEDTYYVAVLMNRTPRDREEFRRMVYSPATPGQVSTVMGAVYTQDTQDKTREQVLALIKAEYGYSDENPKLNERIDDR